MNFKSESSFTLIELLIVIGVIAVLATAVVVVMNPMEYFKKSRDSTRMSELQTINKALGQYLADGKTYLGETNKVYVSIPDNASQICASLGLPALPTGWEYRCSNSANYRKVDSTGWIPVPFTSISFGSNLAILPIDPINTTSTGNYYTYVPGGSWKLTSLFESEKYAKNMNKDGGPDPGVYEIGTNLNLANFARGLVGYWKFDEGSGTAAGDSSGNNNIGTLINSPTWTSGKVSGALSFDGVDDYVDVGNNLEWPGALTVSTWHRRTTKDTVRADGIVGNWFWDPDTQLRRGWVIRYYINTDSLVFMIELTNGSLVTERHLGFTMSVGEWYHVVGVFNPDRTTKLYVNGVLRATDTAPAGYNQIAYDSPYPMLIGYNPVNAGYFPGLIDEVRIYNRALSAAEITAIYNATK